MARFGIWDHLCQITRWKDTNVVSTGSIITTAAINHFWSVVLMTGNYKNVNTLTYSPFRLVKIWDYQNKTCVQTLAGHSQNVCVTAFHPSLPVILSGSEDGTVRVWHAHTYRHEQTLNYGMERVWALACMKGSNNVGIGYDDGSVIIKVLPVFILCILILNSLAVKIQLSAWT